MFRRISSLLSLYLILITSASAQPLKIAGHYLSVGPHKTELNITQKGNEISLYFLGGGNPDDGASMSGDCEVVAKGRLAKRSLIANIVPFKGEVFSLTKDEVENAKFDTLIKVKFGNKLVHVQLNLMSYCGLGNDMSGKYTLVNKVSR